MRMVRVKSLAILIRDFVCEESKMSKPSAYAARLQGYFNR